MFFFNEEREKKMSKSLFRYFKEKTNLVLVLSSCFVLLLIISTTWILFIERENHDILENLYQDPQGGSESALLKKEYAIAKVQRFDPKTGWEPSDLTEWGSWGKDLNNSKWSKQEKLINPLTAKALKVLWTFQAGDMITAHPASVDGILYFCSWDGFVYSLNQDDGSLLWKKRLSDYSNRTDSFCRNTPSISDGSMIVGDQVSGTLFNLDIRDGSLIWSFLVDSHPAAIITQSILIYRGTIYGGVSSREEAFANEDSYECCSFMGSVFSVSLRTGKLIWKTLMLNSNNGSIDKESGVAVWGSQPSLWPEKHILFVATGNNYKVRESIQQCLREEGPFGHTGRCRIPGDYSNSIVAIDIRNGNVLWYFNATGVDAWNVACLNNRNNCPENFGPDFDFAQAPMIFQVRLSDGKSVMAVGAGQKSGLFWCLNALTGELIYVTNVGPGSTLGGMQWGSTHDDERIYVQITNADKVKYDFAPRVGVHCGGFWSALDINTGRKIWVTPDPDSLKGQDCDDPLLLDDNLGISMGALTAANSKDNTIVFAPSMAGKMYALEGKTGKILNTFLLDGSGFSGATVVEGKVFFGSGYRLEWGYIPGKTMYAIGL